MPSSRPAAVRPFSGESQSDFAARFHQAMGRTIPETETRNNAMLDAWESAGGDGDLLRRAAARFTPAEFVRVRNVPIFAEHTTRDAKGNLVVYDRRALAAIVDRCNARIRDTADFPPLTEGHTPTPEEQTAGRAMPEVLGYAGPFRVGLIGNDNPRWAIFADEHHHAEDRDRLKKLRRRSPEVWLEERMEDRFLDPIAALGAETPRLDLGTSAKFSRRYRRRGDRIVEIYSAAVPTATGANTTYVPGPTGGDDDRKDRYEGQGMISPEDVQQIVDAVLATAPMQWVQSQMQGGAGPDAGMPAPDAGMPDPAGAPPMGDAPPAPPPPGPPAPDAGGPPPALPPAPPEAAADDGMEDDYEPDDDDREQFRRYMAGECSDDEMDQYRAGRRQTRKGFIKRRKKHYAAEGTADDSDGKPAAGEVTTIPVNSKPSTPGAEVADPQIARFSKGKTMPMTQEQRVEQARYAKLQEEVNQIKKERDAERIERRKAERYSKLNELRQYHAFDVEEEVAETADYSDQQFEKHLDRIVSKYQRIPVGTRVFVPPEAAPAQYARGRDSGRKEVTAAENEKVIALADRYRKQGKEVTYVEALAEVRNEGTAAAATKTA